MLRNLFPLTRQARTFATSPQFHIPSISAWKALSQAVSYRIGRWYYSFYYSQYTNKYVLVFLFPAFFFAVRFGHDTTLAYRVYMDEPAENTQGSPSSYAGYLEEMKIEKDPSETSSIDVVTPKNKMNSIFTGKYSNGSKIYMEDEATVTDLKKKFFGEEHIKFQASCHGRILEDTDSLAFSVRAYCKRDPKIYLQMIHN